MIIDSHCHIHDKKFAHDLKEVLYRAKLANISHFITIGCDIATTRNAAHLSHEIEQVFFTAGFHPHDAQHLTHESFLVLKELARHKKCVAVGEIGLDYFYLHSSKEVQQNAFKKQLDLALELNLPVVIHLRDAFDDCLAIIKGYPELLKKRIVIHCFSGTLNEATTFESLGCLISLSGIITFKKSGELKDVASGVALDRLLVETDCPYLSPEPFRGQRNEPAYIIHTLKVIAEARNQELSVVSTQIHKNTMAFFKLPGFQA
jgi:TatD DNase family protein